MTVLRRVSSYGLVAENIASEIEQSFDFFYYRPVSIFDNETEGKSAQEMYKRGFNPRARWPQL